MLGVPFLAAFVPGVFIILLTWWFRRKRLSVFIRVIPSALTLIASGIYIYVGIIKIRGFEGAAYGFLAFFLLLFAIVALYIALKRPSSNKDIKQDLNP